MTHLNNEAIFCVLAGIGCFLVYIIVIIKLFGIGRPVRKRNPGYGEVIMKLEDDRISGAWSEEVIN